MKVKNLNNNFLNPLYSKTELTTHYHGTSKEKNLQDQAG